MAKERFPFYSLKVGFICFDFISFFQKAQKLVKVGNFISQLTLPNIKSAHETGEVDLQFCIELCGFSPKAVVMARSFPF